MKFYSLLLLLIVSFSSEASRCDQDKRKYCHNLTGARGEIAKCLSEHIHELTPACSQELKEFKANALKKNPCFQELADYCADIPNKQPNLNYCLLNNESRLGQKCLSDFSGKKAQILKEDFCAKDVIAHCYPDIKGPNGAITRCLIREKKKLSKACLTVTDKMITKMKISNPCFDDTEKYCPTQLRMIDIQECLEKKLNQLRPQCKSIVHRELELGKSNPCYKDVMRNCRPDSTPKEQETCLDLSYKEVSQSCKDFRKAEADKIEKMRVSCEIDRLKLCKNVPFQDGLVLKCLNQNRAKLTLECRKFF